MTSSAGPLFCKDCMAERRSSIRPPTPSFKETSTVQSGVKSNSTSSHNNKLIENSNEQSNTMFGPTTKTILKRVLWIVGSNCSHRLLAFSLTPLIYFIYIFATKEKTKIFFITFPSLHNLFSYIFFLIWPINKTSGLAIKDDKIWLLLR